MAKRRKLEMPKPEDLVQIEEQFRSETSPQKRSQSLTPPIAQVAADVASSAPLQDAETRAKIARDSKDAAQLREAQENGLIVSEIDISKIDPDDMTRDRVIINEDEMEELRRSIQANGLRLPIEVYERATDDPNDFKYGVLSGYRRLLAVKTLFGMTQAKVYSTIKCFIRAPKDVPAAIVAMVEENEVRANLSHFERGRIASISAQNGPFGNVEEAVNVLFATASKAKRSKIRSFAHVFEELGDLLTEPETISERYGLRLANVLRLGGAGALRDALDAAQGTSAAEDQAAMEPVLLDFERTGEGSAKGGRPKSEKASRVLQERRLQNGIILRQETDGKNHFIRLAGKQVDRVLVEHALDELHRLLDTSFK